MSTFKEIKRKPWLETITYFVQTSHFPSGRVAELEVSRRCTRTLKTYSTKAGTETSSKQKFYVKDYPTESITPSHLKGNFLIKGPITLVRECTSIGEVKANDYTVNFYAMFYTARKGKGKISRLLRHQLFL